jgi:hypothetical protein
VHLGLVQIVALAVGVLVSLYAARARAADIILPPDLQRVVDENARSVARLRSVNVSATIAEMFEVDGKRASFEDNIAIWTKGRKVREDRSAVSGTSLRSRRVVESLPDGSRMTIGPPDASRHVITPEVEFKFRPGDRAIALVAGEPDAPFGRQSSLLHGFTSVQGRTLARKVREDWDHGYRPTVTTVTDDDVDSVLVNWDYAQSRMVLKVWVEPTKGYMIRKLQAYYQNELVTDWTSQLKEYGDGVFWPDHVEQRDWRSGRVTRQLLVNVNRLEINPAVDDAMFTLAGIGLPQGAEVQDRILGLRYRFGAEPRLSEDFVQSVIAPNAGGGAASVGAARPEARGPRVAPAERTERTNFGSASPRAAGPIGLVAIAARSPWTWSIFAALTTSAGAAGFLLRRRRNRGPANN